MDFETLLGLAIIAGNIFTSVYAFGGWRTAPKWLVITSGVMNLLMLVAIIWLTK